MRNSLAITVLFLTGVILLGCNTKDSLTEEPRGSNATTSGGTSGTSSTGTGTSTGTSGSTPGTATTSTGTTPPDGFVTDRKYQLSKLQVANCTIKGKAFRLWVMDTNDKHMEGMMHLKNGDFKDDQGMVFVFQQEEPRKFWMRNTLIDLDVAYCGKDGKINSVYTMKALDETSDFSSKAPSKYVIELRAGAMKKNNIGPGDKWSIPKDVFWKPR